MKKLFKFELDREVTSKEKETSKNDKGETVTTEKEVTKTVKQTVFLRKPTRSLYDGAELFYGVKLSEGIKAGLLTRALLAKRFSNDGGVLSNDEKDRYAELYLKLYETQLDAERLSANKDDQDQEKLESLLEESADIRRQLTDFEMAQSQLFEQTAENRARNKTILWWVLNLSHFEDEDGKSSVIFEGKDFEEKLNSYDSMEEGGDDFDEELLQKLIYYVSFWYVGRVSNQEEFDNLLKSEDIEKTLTPQEMTETNVTGEQQTEEEEEEEEETQEETEDTPEDLEEESTQKEND
tara:strand:+ start:1560 stop:2441 length:882 start_codon:yes stop_codon:yes gene_type:complete